MTASSVVEKILSQTLVKIDKNGEVFCRADI